MKLVADNVGVDSGTIFISDIDFYKKQGEREASNEECSPDLIQTFDIEKGVYNIKWKMPNTWNGDVEGTGIVNITSGKLVVADPCYLISEERWSPLLDETDYFKKPMDGIVILDKHGGDGGFIVEIELIKQEDKNENENGNERCNFLER